MTTPQATGRRLPPWMLGSGFIAASMGVMNLATYGFTLIAARLLGPREYGVLAALMGLLLVLNVVSLGLQATAARRVSAAPQDVSLIETQVVRASYRAAVVVGAATLLASPVLVSVLRFDSWWEPALLAVSTVPLTIMGAQAGLFQGERRWLPLAAVYLAVGLGRIGFGVLGMVWRQDAVGAMLGVAVGNVVPAVLGWWLLRRPTEDRPPVPRRPAAQPRSVFGEVAHNSHALLAFFALANADVVLARVTLDEHEAGLYAGGVILAKAVLFLPQFVVVLAFPSMAARSRAGLHLRGLGVVAGIGLLAVAAAAALPSLAVTFVGGPEYASLEPMMWGFAALGMLLALIQMLVYEVVARQHQRAVLAIWAALAVLLAAAAPLATVGQLLTVVCVVDLVLLGVLLAVGLRAARPVARMETTAAVAASPRT